MIFKKFNFFSMKHVIIKRKERNVDMSALQPQQDMITLELYEALPENVRAAIYQTNLNPAPIGNMRRWAHYHKKAVQPKPDSF